MRSAKTAESHLSLLREAKVFKKLKISWKKAIRHLLPLGGFSSGNKVRIFHDGDQAFQAIHNSFGQAEKSIHVETYIFTPDKIGLWLRDALIAASKRGVQVLLLYDHFGSASLNSGFLAPMVDSGIKVIAFNPIWPWRRSGPLLFRDHRKIIVVDQQIAFCGSMNISSDYAGPIYGTDRFRDSLAQVSGPAVKDLLEITEESIAESLFDQQKVYTPVYQEDLSLLARLDQFIDHLFKPAARLNTSNKKCLVQVLRSNQRRNLRHIQKSMEESINRAISYCYFTTPYFLPYESLRKAIIHAAQRGVDLRILTAGLSDIPLMRFASRHVYKSLLDNNIKIYEMHKKTLHAKLATIDGVYASIGSYNLDHWSARRNLEVNLTILDAQISQELKCQFEQDLKLAQEIKPEIFAQRSWWRRVIYWLSYVVFRL